MIETLRISFALRNTYRVNGILYSLKQIPLLKKLLPDRLYQVKGLKIFANFLSAVWEVISVFLGKFLYFFLMIWSIGNLYEKTPKAQTFLHILLFLTLIGAYMNTSLFNPTRDKYYAMILMRMNAREYTLVNYGYEILKVVIGFLPFSVFFGMKSGAPFLICLAIPFGVAGVKLMAAACTLRIYEKNGYVYHENQFQKHLWLIAGILLAAAYGLPAAGVVLPSAVSVFLLLIWIPAGVFGIRKVLRFGHYREINQELLARTMNQMDELKQSVKTSGQKSISADLSITSSRKGFEYLNELFVRRHQKILWKASRRITSVCAVLICAVFLVLCLAPEYRQKVNHLVMNWLPYFLFIMYSINRGSEFTRALFLNCDHSLLTYSFFRRPEFILKLFRIRLREIMKINAVPALVIGSGLCLILYASGGAENLLNYAVLFVSILCMSCFFSIHYLTVYYLLQPYNAGIEMKSGTYQIVLSVTYFVCLCFIQVKLPILVFGMACILFCLSYFALACVLIYRLAPKTFRLRT